jgi:hypothetical protein
VNLRRAGGVSLLWLAAAATTSSCIYDPKDRCSPGEKVNENGYCVCKDGYVPKYADVAVVTSTPAGEVVRVSCVPCGEHEVAKGETCICDAGYARASDKSPCELAMAPDVNYGDSCSGDADCTGPGATCIQDDVIGTSKTQRAGYCSTRDCKSAADCPADKKFGCHAGAKGKFCRKPPAGEGDACDMTASRSDNTNPACTGEATACAFNICITPETCSGDDSCTPGLVCCDLSSIPQAMGAIICLPPDSCLTR